MIGLGSGARVGKATIFRIEPLKGWHDIKDLKFVIHLMIF